MSTTIGGRDLAGIRGTTEIRSRAEPQPPNLEVAADTLPAELLPLSVTRGPFDRLQDMLDFDPGTLITHLRKLDDVGT